MHIHGFIYIYFCYLSLKQRNLEMRTLICSNVLLSVYMFIKQSELSAVTIHVVIIYKQCFITRI